MILLQKKNIQCCEDLHDLVAIPKKNGLCRMLDNGLRINFVTVKHLQIRKLSQLHSLGFVPFPRYLDSGIQLFGEKCNLNWEKIIGIAMTGKLHGASFIVGVNQRELPQQSSSFFIRIFSITFSNNWGPTSMPEERKKVVNHEVVMEQRPVFYGMGMVITTSCSSS